MQSDQPAKKKSVSQKLKAKGSRVKRHVTGKTEAKGTAALTTHNDPTPAENTPYEGTHTSPKENGKDDETGDTQAGEAGWTPQTRPRGKKARKDKKGLKKKTKNHEPDSTATTEEVLAILLPDEGGPAIAPTADNDASSPEVKKKKATPALDQPRRNRSLSEANKKADRTKGFFYIDSSDSDSENDFLSSSSSSSDSEDDAALELDFDNLRKYPKSLLKAFCKNEHITVESKKNRKQRSKQDYINALLAYNKGETVASTSSYKSGFSRRKEDRKKKNRALNDRLSTSTSSVGGGGFYGDSGLPYGSTTTNSSKKRDVPAFHHRSTASPFHQHHHHHQNQLPSSYRYLASSQPAYMPSFARGMSEEEMIALAIEESLKEQAGGPERKKTEEGDKEKGGEESGGGAEKSDKEKPAEAPKKNVDDDEEAKDKREKKNEREETKEKEKDEKEKKTKSSSLTSSGKKPASAPAELDGSQFDSDEAFARALQMQLEREAEESDTDSDDEDDDEILRYLDRRGGLLHMLEMMAGERARPLAGRTPGSYGPSVDASVGPLASMLRARGMGLGGGGSRHRDIDPDNMTYEELLELGEKIGDVKKKGASSTMITTNTQTFNYRVPKPMEERKENSRCPICLTDFEEGEEVRMLPCIHLYHKDCVDKWLSLNATCCICQRPLLGSDNL